MPFRILLEEGGDALLVEPGSYLLYQDPNSIGVPDRRTLYVFPKRREFPVAPRGQIWVPPRRNPGEEQ